MFVLLYHLLSCDFFFFFNDTATTEIYTLSLHDALPISRGGSPPGGRRLWPASGARPGPLRAGSPGGLRHPRVGHAGRSERGSSGGFAAAIESWGEGSEGGQSPPLRGCLAARRAAQRRDGEQ